MSRSPLRRADLELPAADIGAALERIAVAHVATVGPDGAPYVVPQLFVWVDGEIHLHSAGAAGQFRRNIDHCPHVCIEASEMGTIYPYGAFACDTTTSYVSVIAHGTIRIEPDDAAKARFFDRFLAKYADPDWKHPPGFYPRLGQVTVYAVAPDRLTGKHIALPPLAGRWPAVNNSKTPNARPPSA